MKEKIQGREKKGRAWDIDKGEAWLEHRALFLAI
jgi:hypothetical protein